MSTIKWDEETIALHDKERGTRQKIDEPNTPFRYAGDLEDEHFNVAENAELSATEYEKAAGVSTSSISSVNGAATGYGDVAGRQVPAVAPVLSDQWSRLNATLEYEAQKQAGNVAPSAHHTHAPSAGNIAAGVDDVAAAAPTSIFNLNAGAVAGVPSCLITSSSSQPAWKQVGRHKLTGENHLSPPASDDEGEDANMTEEERVRHLQFKKKREAHYNEFKLIQAMKQKEALKRQRRIDQGRDPDESTEEEDDDGVEGGDDGVEGGNDDDYEEGENDRGTGMDVDA